MPMLLEPTEGRLHWQLSHRTVCWCPLTLDARVLVGAAGVPRDILHSPDVHAAVAAARRNRLPILAGCAGENLAACSTAARAQPSSEGMPAARPDRLFISRPEKPLGFCGRG